MKLAIYAFATLLLVAGLVLIIKPDLVVNLIESNKEKTWLYILAILIRAVLGIFFILSAHTSKYPMAFKIIGLLFILSAIFFLFIGQNNFQSFISTAASRFTPFAPISGVLSLAFGGFIIFAIQKNSKLEIKE